MVMRRIKRLAKGQGLVEFALILPILLIILLGIVEAALLIQGHLTVQHIARETTRWAITYRPVQGACMDRDNDGVIADGVGIDDEAPFGIPDDDDVEDFNLPWPDCPIGDQPNPLEDDEDYYKRRVELIKRHAIELSGGLRVRRDVAGLSETDFFTYDDTPGFFGVRVWGYPAADVNCNLPALAGKTWDPDEGTLPDGRPKGPDGCLDHPGLEGLPVLVHIQHNVEIVDPFYRIFGEHLAVQANAQMINEGVQVGMGDQPVGGFSWNPGFSTGDPGTGGSTEPTATPGPTATPAPTATPIPYADYSIVLSDTLGFKAANNEWIDRCHDFVATVTLDGTPWANAWVNFRIDPPVTVGSFSYSGTGTPTTEAQTDALGRATVTICGNDAGTAVIRAWLDIGPQPGVFELTGAGPGGTDPEPSDTATKTWVLPVPPNPYIVVSRYEAISEDPVEAYAMQHAPNTEYGLFWCVIPDTGSVDTSQLLPLRALTGTVMSFVTDAAGGTYGNSGELAFNVPVGSEGWYQLETRPTTSNCLDGDPVAVSPPLLITLARPDLTITGIYPPTEMMCPGNLYPVDVVIQNVANGRTNELADVDFDMDPPNPPPVDDMGDHKEWLPAMEPLEVYTLTTSVWFGEGGAHDLWVRLDTSDLIWEQVESNNVLSATFNVSGAGTYCEDNGSVVIDATDYQEIASGSCDGTSVEWVASSVSSVPTMLADASSDVSCGDYGEADASAVLKYDVNFVTTGIYYAYFRGEAQSGTGNHDSVWLSVDGAPSTNPGNGNCYRLAAQATSSLNWDNNIQVNSGDPSTTDCLSGADLVLAVRIDDPGPHTIEVRVRESGYEWAKLMLIHDDYIAMGPPSGGSRARAIIVPEVRPRPAMQTTVVDADFDSDTDGFNYSDDTFRGTSQGYYARGDRLATGGFGGSGGLRVRLGGRDDNNIYNMSGGWQETFNLSAASDVAVSFRYNLTQAQDYEAGECSDMLMSMNGVLYGSGATDYIAQICGDGNGGGARSTGWQVYTTNIGSLGAGNHTLIIGGYNNRKTETSEQTAILIDDVTVTTTPSTPTGSLPWEELFPQGNGTTQDTGATAWTSFRASGSFAVQDNRFCIVSGGSEGVWQTELIDISSASSVDISLDLWSDGGMESDPPPRSDPAADWFYVYYVIDGGAEQLIDGIDGRTAGPDPENISISGLSGNTLRLVVRTRTTGGVEEYCFDNINIAASGPTAVPTETPTPGPTSTPTIPPTAPPATPTPPSGGDDPPPTYCDCSAGSDPDPWSGGKPPGLLECVPQLLDDRTSGFEGNFYNVFPPWYPGPALGSWLRTSNEFYPADPTNSMRLATSLDPFIESCQPLPDPWVYQTITIPSTEVYTNSTLVVRGQVLVRPPRSDVENECCRTTDTYPDLEPDPDDSLYVQMLDSGGGVLEIGDTGVEIASGSTTSDRWVSFNADVTDVVSPVARMGQDVRVHFYGTQGGAVDPFCSYFFLDDLTCELCTYWPPPAVDPGLASFGGMVTVIEGTRPLFIKGVDVYAFSIDGTGVYRHTTTIQDGSYHFYNLPIGTYKIYAVYRDDRLNADVQTVVVGMGDRNDIHFFLASGGS
jgi:hypothetical protein